MVTLAEPINGTLFFAGEHTMPFFWGCVHGALLSARREYGRITGDFSLFPGGKTAEPRGKREAKMMKIRKKITTVMTKHALT